ncbi:CheR family methyltransferase [Allorhodopirellula solitaria]|uniref:Chemotaxis protein methyltransferase n=1 Tax=Allorhodopirellula solitaria TaxID=2527987 RepID=A0A5C5X1G9_9BACT|nr:CheR family methyltransferase [Allorhodopirellula solitaria]TWT56062.1 Chemotaxis protein methyltransferase [Allorhodopirellula solitaria]
MSKPAQPDVPIASPSAPDRFPIVGVGASAGGLQALRRLLEAVPEAPRFALVIVHHLARDRPSLAPELLAKYTRMPVNQVDDGPLVKPGHVYVIPPGQFLSIDDGRLSLTRMEGPRRTPVAIDFFFRALAKDQQQCAVGIILSGTGSDGTLGVKAIKEAGGLVLAQELNSTEFSGMPDSAINTGIVDQVLTPEAMPEILARFASHDYICGEEATQAAGPKTSEVKNFRHEGSAPAPRAGTAEPAAETPDSNEAGLGEIIKLLAKQAKRDFQNYKLATLSRRTRRRMCLHHIDRYEDYLEFLGEHPDEIQALAKDLLISVTDFFRDPRVWEKLAAHAIPEIVASKSHDDVVRVWSAGCATGEEAYSIAMLCLEEIGRQRKSCRLQVFASDIDVDALDRARSGNYPTSIEADVSRERLKRFFTLRDGDVHYQVNKSLRETVVFADQNVIADPPFSQLDMVCCRNLLIYLKPDLQQKIISLFHFALRQQGYLLLGTAETVGRHEDLFKTIDKSSRIFQSRGRTAQDKFSLPANRIGPRREYELPTRPALPKRPAQLAQQKLLAMMSARAVLINRQWQILYICGDVNPYLTHQEGVPNDNLLRKIVPILRSQLRAAVQRAYHEDTDVSVVCRGELISSASSIRLDVRLISGEDQQDDFALIVFEDVTDNGDRPNTRPAQPPSKAGGTAPTSEATLSSIDENTQLHQLEKELAATQDDLQSTVEQFEAASEEHKASNEEVMSINEELQSTNEELETGKEELQSLNEELSTVNQQLASKVGELEVKHADLENLISATEVPTACLGRELTIRWFTPAMRELIRIKPADIGRPLGDLHNDFLNDHLVDECEQVLQRLTPVEKEVDCSGDRTFIRRIVPYRTDDHRIGGVVITLMDITSRRKREVELEESEEKLRDANRTLERRVARRTELLTILQHVTRIANEAQSVESAMRLAMAGLADFNGWRIGHLWRLSTQHDSEMPRLTSTKIWHVSDQIDQQKAELTEFQRRIEQTTIDTPGTLAGIVAETGQPQQVRDISEVPDALQRQAAAAGLRGAIAFPIMIREETVAVIEFFSEEPTSPEPEFLEIMPEVGIQLGHVVQRKRLERVVADIANEEERRIGRELHDGIAQQLTGGALIAESIRARMPPELSPQITNLDHLIEILQEAHEDVSRLSRGLMPDTVAAADLMPSLNRLAAELERRFRIDITLHCEEFDDSFVRIDAAAATIYQIARESLHNAIKHSGSGRIDVELSTSDFFRMVVVDRGDGFDTRQIKPKSNGLRIMRYRAEMIGGELTVETADGDGTRIILTIPLKRCQS